MLVPLLGWVAVAARRAALASGLLLGAALSLAPAGAARAADPPPAAAAATTAPAEVSYYKEIRPIFQAQCQGCHQPAKANGKYVMTSMAELVKGGESEEPAIVPGEPGKSKLFAQITPDSAGKAEMPKERPSLVPAELELVRRWIAAGAKDDTPANAKETHDAAHPPTYEQPPIITALDFSPDSTLLAVGGYHEVLLHKADGSALVGRLIGVAERIQSVKFSPDGKRLAVTGGLPARMGEVQIWDVATQKLHLSVPVSFDTIYGASWSPDGKFVAFGCSDNTVRAIDAETGKQVFYNGAHSDWVLGTIFSLKGDHLISISRDMSVKLSVFAEQRFVDNITSITPGALKGGVLAIDRNPAKEEILVGGSDGQPKIYKIFRTQARKIGDDFNKIRDFAPLPGRIFTVQYSPDGSKVLAVSFNGQGDVRLFQEADSKQLWQYSGPAIYVARFRPDGQAIAAAGYQGSVVLLSATDGKPISEFVPVTIEKK